MTLLNSSLISSLCASNNNKIRSDLSANHLATFPKSSGAMSEYCGCSGEVNCAISAVLLTHKCDLFSASRLITRPGCR